MSSRFLILMNVTLGMFVYVIANIYVISIIVLLFVKVESYLDLRSFRQDIILNRNKPEIYFLIL